MLESATYNAKSFKVENLADVSLLGQKLVEICKEEYKLGLEKIRDLTSNSNTQRFLYLQEL